MSKAQRARSRVQQSHGIKPRVKFFALALGILLLALCFPAEAQQPTKIPRIGFLICHRAASTR